jgi:hypothetical protein
MIRCNEMFEPILRVTPSFSTRWNALHEEWREQLPPFYLLLGELSRHMKDLLAAGRREELLQIFDIVEQWHWEGEPDVRVAATIGLLEDLQNTNGHQHTAPADFLPFLRPETKFWWDKVERFWVTGAAIVDDRRS